VPTAQAQDNGEVKPRAHSDGQLKIRQFTAAPIFDTAATS